MHFLYSLMLAGASLLLAPLVFLVPSWRSKYVPSLGARLGRLPETVRPAGDGAIWVHAVSVGETLAVEPLVRGLQRRFPERRVLVSTTTRTGQELARLRFGEDTVFYFPLDFAFACRRVLRVVRPALVIIAETEIWPNFLREAKRSGAAVVFVNGRVSNNSFRGYRRWKLLFASVLARADLFLMQTRTDAERIAAAGAKPSRIRVTGNLKFDQPDPRPAAFVAALERIAAGAPVLVAGSTLGSEEEKLLEAVTACVTAGGRKPLLVLAPRHPARFSEVARMLDDRHMRWQRRTALEEGGRRPDVILLDTLGELAGTYSAATIAFVGGSLVPGGGHNPIEPALWGKPVVFGPSMENFHSVSEAMKEAGAAFEVRSPMAMGVLLAALFSDEAARQRAGTAARAVVEKERGATERSVSEIVALLESREGSSP